MTAIRSRITLVLAASLLAVSLVILTAPHSAAAASDGFVPLTPTRILDTRTSLGGHPGQIGSRGTVTVEVAGYGGVPEDAVAVALNVTVTGPTAPGYLTVYPADAGRPSSSNVNFAKGQAIANDVTTALSADGRVKIFSYSTAHVVVDVAGYFTAGSGFRAMAPRRLLDTRSAVGAPTKNPVGQKSSIDVTVAGTGTGVPADAAAVALNVTATETGGNGYVTAYPAGTTRPVSSTANYLRGETVPGLAIVKVGTGGKVSLFTYQRAHLIADVQGYFTTGGEYVGLNPARVVDTRFGDGVPKAKIAKNTSLSFRVTGVHGVPATGVSAVFLNVTSVNALTGGHDIVHASQVPRPIASLVNFPAGGVVANSILAKVGADGKVTVFSSATSDVVVDVAGYVRGELPVLTDSNVSVATWNLCGQDKCVSTANGMKPWNPVRKPIAGAWARSFVGGIVSTQESQSTETRFETELPGYAVAAYRSAKSLFYDTTRYVVEDSGTITLDATRKRYAVWAAFRSIHSGARFIVVDPHLEPTKGKKYDDIRNAQTQVLLREVDRANPLHLPVVYAGDYNSNKSNANQTKYPGGYDAPAQVFAAAGIPDALTLATVKRNADYNSANQAKNPPLKHGDHVDHVYVDQGVVRVDVWEMFVRLDGTDYLTPFASDHNPIQVDLTVPVL